MRNRSPNASRPLDSALPFCLALLMEIALSHTSAAAPRATVSPTPSVAAPYGATTTPTQTIAPTTSASASSKTTTRITVTTAEELTALSEEVRFDGTPRGPTFLRSLLERMLKEKTERPAFTFVFSPRRQPAPSAPYGISRAGLHLHKVVEHGKACQTTVTPEPYTPTGKYPLIEKQVGGACAAMTTYRSIFKTLKLQAPPATNIFETTPEGTEVINPELLESLLRLVPDGIHMKGLTRNEAQAIYEGYTTDPNYVADCIKTPILFRDRDHDHYYKDIITAAMRERECKDLQSHVKDQHDCSLGFNYGERGAHSERTVSARWDAGTKCCIIETEDATLQGHGIDLPFTGSLTNVTRFCGNSKFQSTVDEGMTLKTGTVYCCKKQKKGETADEPQLEKVGK